MTQFKYLNPEQFETLEQAKKAYHELCKQFHPDKHDKSEQAYYNQIMQQINVEYQECMRIISIRHSVNGNESERQSASQSETKEESKAFVTALSAIIALDGLEIEICGKWIWVSGDTFPHKETLKQAGFKWSNKKRMWYFGKIVGKKTRCTMSQSEIRMKYGSKKIETRSSNQKNIIIAQKEKKGGK